MRGPGETQWFENETKSHEHGKGTCGEEVRIHGGGRETRKAVGIGSVGYFKKDRKLRGGRVDLGRFR